MKNFFRIKSLIIIIFILFIFQEIICQEAYIVRPYPTTDLDILTRLCSIDRILKDGSLLIYANDQEFQSIKSLVDFQGKYIENIDFSNTRMSVSIQDFSTTWDSYPTRQQYLDLMNKFDSDYPSLCRLDTIGFTTKNKPILLITLTSQVDNIKCKPRFQYQSSMHGNELTGYILMLRFIDYLLSNYGAKSIEGSRVTRLLDNIEITIIPILNLDGAYKNSDTTVFSSQRGNSNGTDLNRNFPDQYRDKINTTTGREKETATIMNYIKNNHIVLSANFHTGAIVMNYPYDGLTNGKDAVGIANNCPDSTWFRYLSLKYATSNSDMSNSTQFPMGISNGAEWYTVYGGRQDWIYAFHQGREVTIELSNSGIPTGTELQRQWDINKESMLAYMEVILSGIHGRITDENNNPISGAKLHLLEIPETDVYSDSITGCYFRLILSGTYNLVASCDGYISDTVKNIELQIDSITYVNFKLKKSTSDIKSSEFNSNLICSINPQPVSNYLNLSIQNYNKNKYFIEIYDNLAQKQDLVNSFEKYSNSSCSIDVSFLNTGIYFIILKDETGKLIFYSKFFKI